MKKRVLCILLRAVSLAISVIADMLCNNESEDGLPPVPL